MGLPKQLEIRSMRHAGSLGGSSAHERAPANPLEGPALPFCGMSLFQARCGADRLAREPRLDFLFEGAPIKHRANWLTKIEWLPRRASCAT